MTALSDGGVVVGGPGKPQATTPSREVERITATRRLFGRTTTQRMLRAGEGVIGVMDWARVTTSGEWEVIPL